MGFCGFGSSCTLFNILLQSRDLVFLQVRKFDLRSANVSLFPVDGDNLPFARVILGKRHLYIKWFSREIIVLVYSFYKSAFIPQFFFQVSPVLDKLESEYVKGEDCCTVLWRRAIDTGSIGGSVDGKAALMAQGPGAAPLATPSGPKTRIDFVVDQLQRHSKNKDSFLKGCSLARKNCELFLKYIRRQVWVFLSV